MHAIPLLLSLLLLPLFEARTALQPLDRDDRVVGGKDVPDGSVNWVASLQYKMGNMHFCGGTVINDFWVFTAAHCMVNTAKDSFQVVTGGTDLDMSGLQVRLPEKVIVADYNTTEKYNDMALIKMRTRLEPSSRSAGGYLQLAETRPDAGAICTVLGWGLTQNGGNVVRKLQMASMTAQSNEQCNRAYSAQHYTIYESMLCVGGGAKDACQGDSGGPLVCRVDGGAASGSDRTSELRLAGAVSWGVQCATPGLPGVYADVAHGRHWIMKQLREDEDQ